MKMKKKPLKKWQNKIAKEQMYVGRHIAALLYRDWEMSITLVIL